MPTLNELVAEKPEYRQKQIREFISEENGEIVVNWEAIADYERKHHRSEEFLGSVYHLLRDLGILSKIRKGNYLITGADVAINPRDKMLTMYYFTRLKDAEGFRRAFYRNALYDTPIFQGLDIEQRLKS